MIMALMLAQMSSTQCYPVGNQVHCDTSSTPGLQVPPPVDWNRYFFQQQQNQSTFSDNFARALQARRAREEAQRQQEEAQEAQNQQREDQWRREAVGKMVADGKCDDARKEALQFGDFDLARQVAQVCKSPSP